MFEPGQLVECVDDSEVETFLSRRRVYTVRWAGPFPRATYGRGKYLGSRCGVHLHEAMRPLPFAVERFRPLPEERLSIFRKMLEPIEDRDLVASSSVAAEGEI